MLRPILGVMGNHGGSDDDRKTAIMSEVPIDEQISVLQAALDALVEGEGWTSDNPLIYDPIHELAAIIETQIEKLRTRQSGER